MLSRVAISLLFLGILPRFRPHISVETCVSLPLLRQQWGTRLAHNVRHCSAAQRLGLQAPRSAGYCLTPTAALSKTERGPISMSGPLYSVWHRTRRFLRKNQSVSPHSLPPNRRTFSRGRRRSTPVAPGAPAGWPAAAMPVLSLISPSSPKQLGMVSPKLMGSLADLPMARRSRRDPDPDARIMTCGTLRCKRPSNHTLTLGGQREQGSGEVSCQEECGRRSMIYWASFTGK